MRQPRYMQLSPHLDSTVVVFFSTQHKYSYALQNNPPPLNQQHDS